MPQPARGPQHARTVRHVQRALAKHLGELGIAAREHKVLDVYRRDLATDALFPDIALYGGQHLSYRDVVDPYP
jgi:hypothetical protein